MGWITLDRSHRVVASLLLLVTVWGSPHRQMDDEACLPVVAGEHDASKHVFAPLAPVDQDHCAVCHWMRGLKPAFITSTLAWTPFALSRGLAVAVAITGAAPLPVRLPARAPPVTPDAA